MCVCVSVGLFSHHAKRMPRIILWSVACPALPYIFTLSHKWHDFRKKYYSTQNVCFDFLYIFCENFLFLRRIQRDAILNVHRSSCKVPILLVRFEIDLNFLDRFLKNTQISNFMKIRSLRAELFHADGHRDRQTDEHEANSHFS